MNFLKILSLVGKVAGVVAGFNVLPFVPPAYLLDAYRSPTAA